jgi:hypothetical protein
MQQQEETQVHHQPLNEGLRRGDLKDSIDPVFTIDQFKSKMGADQDVIVMRFRCTEKMPATDLMEFIEKGYAYVLDADISQGEEKDGKYSVFVELERTQHAANQMKEILEGIGQLCDNTDWKFRFHRDYHSKDFSEEAILEQVPLTPEDYQTKLTEIQTPDANAEVNEFFDQGALDEIVVDESNNITFSKSYAGDLIARLEEIGDYDTLKESLRGGIALDDQSRSQTVWLNKFLGNYDINKISGKFLIRNGDRAVILSKGNW